MKSWNLPHLFHPSWERLGISTNGCMPPQSLQLCPALCDPMDCSPPGSSVHGFIQSRILKWVAMPSSRQSSRPRDWTCVSYISCTDWRFFTTRTTWVPMSLLRNLLSIPWPSLLYMICLRNLRIVDTEIFFINVIYGQEDCVKWIMEIIIFCGILSTWRKGQIASLVAHRVKMDLQCGRPGSIPVSGRSLGKGNGYPL